MKTKCMSCGGPTKKMKTGGATKPKLTTPKPTIATPKMQLGGSLPKAKDGLSCYHRAERTNKRRKYWHSGGGKTIKNIGKNILGAAAVAGAGAIAYKKSPQFKNAVDELKGKLGFNKKGGAVKKYATGGSTKKDCPPGYIWDGYSCVKGPLYSTGAKLGVGAGVAGFLGMGTSMIVDKIKDMKEKKKAKNEINSMDDKKKEKAIKKESKRLEKEFKGTVAPRSLIKKQ